jgi:hypothetical protein
MLEWVSFASAGVIAGLIAGLFGVGGGLIIVPILMTVFSWQGMSADIAIHVAIGTSLMTIAVTSLSSMRAHHHYGTTQWPLVIRLAPGLVVGSLAGAVVATSLPSQLLQRVFALFAVLMAVRLWLPSPPRVSDRLMGALAMRSYGVLTGLISAMVGIGGGTLIVPYLVMAGQSMQKAVGTAAACGFPIAISGVVGFIWMGTQVHEVHAEWQTGFVHWQAFIGVVMTSVFMAPLGAKLARSLSHQLLQRLFSFILLGIGLVLLIR